MTVAIVLRFMEEKKEIMLPPLGSTLIDLLDTRNAWGADVTLIPRLAGTSSGGLVGVMARLFPADYQRGGAGALNCQAVEPRISPLVRTIVQTLSSVVDWLAEC